MRARPVHSKRTNNQGGVHKKALRIARDSSHMPVRGVIAVKGTTSSGTTRTFRFRVVSPIQQARERNKAYHYFSID